MYIPYNNTSIIQLFVWAKPFLSFVVRKITTTVCGNEWKSKKFHHNTTKVDGLNFVGTA